MDNMLETFAGFLFTVATTSAFLLGFAFLLIYFFVFPILNFVSPQNVKITKDIIEKQKKEYNGKIGNEKNKFISNMRKLKKKIDENKEQQKKYLVDINIQIFINNQSINVEEIKENVYVKNIIKTLDKKYIREYNEYLNRNIIESQNKTAKKNLYIILSTKASSAEEATSKIERSRISVQNNFKKMNSSLRQLNINEVIKLYYFLFNNDYHKLSELKDYDYDNQLDFKDIIAPSSLKFKRDNVQVGKLFKKILYLKHYPNFVRDTFLMEVLSTPFTISVSIHINQVDSTEAVRMIQQKIRGMESNKYDYIKKAEQAVSAYIPYDLQLSLEEAYELRDEMQVNNKNLFNVGLYITVTAESQDELDKKAKIVESIANKHLFKLSNLKFRQQEALFTNLPLGKDFIKLTRTLLTDSVAIFLPFSSQDIFHKDGIFYGLSNSKHLLVVDKKLYQNTSGWILGVPGSGKSFLAKKEIVSAFLRYLLEDIMIVDPENEYSPLVKALGGEVIEISVSTNNFINPFDISENYGDKGDPVKAKQEFILSMLEVFAGEMNAKEKSIIDRCVKKLYTDYYANKIENPKTKMPKLGDFYDILLIQKEEEAKDLAIRIERYVKGTMDIFNNYTNININNRLICFNINKLGEELKNAGLLIVFDMIWNRLSKNRDKKKTTRLFLDEIYLLFEHKSTGEFLKKFYKRTRKYGGIPVGIEQNVENLLSSKIARTMLSNAEFKIVLNQSPSDRKELGKLLNISESLLAYITNADAGSGLLIVNKETIPFSDIFPKNSLYQLMTTKLSEVK